MTSEMSVYVLKFFVCICDVSENTLSALCLRGLLYKISLYDLVTVFWTKFYPQVSIRKSL